MARIVSFIVLLVILLVIFGLFFRVMADFLLPMFLALLLVVVFGPLHRWFKGRCKSHDRLAALLTTVTILLIFMGPLAFVVLRAVQEGGRLSAEIFRIPKAVETTEPKSDKELKKLIERQVSTSFPVTGEENDFKFAEETQQTIERLSRKVADLGQKVGLSLDATNLLNTIQSKTAQFLTPLAVSTIQFLGRMMVGAFVMVISLYYFFADGPALIRAMMRLFPLDEKYQGQLIEQFDNITRAVVVATLLSALVQGLLAGVGFYCAGVESVFLLTVLAMLFSLIPFIGAAAVWVPVCLWLYFTPDHSTAAIVLAIYCGVAVSNVDNLIKPLVLHGRSNLHPLLALLSVLGGVQALGPIGIIVGPMAVAFLQTLLEMFHQEMNNLSRGGLGSVPVANNPSSEKAASS